MAVNVKVDTIIDGIRSRILAGEFGESGRLPSFRKLVAEYETSQETMNKAMQALQAEGLVISSGAKGVFVNTPSVHLLGYSSDFYKYLQKELPDPIEEFIEKPVIIEAPAEAAKLMNLPKNALVLRRFKKQGTKDVIFRIVETFYPQKLLSEAMLEKAIEDVSYVPIRDIKKNDGITTTRIKETISIHLPTTNEQYLLKIVRTNPVIELKRICYTKDKIIFYTRMLLNANHFFLSYNYDVNDLE